MADLIGDIKVQIKKPAFLPVGPVFEPGSRFAQI